jgi:2-keto-4-pentenoate hydratase/2-oxohepta-3-ene-1,7-dioic acid hydratase in catechol pathway
MARLTAPIRPSKILGVGTNYRAHAIEMGKPLPDEPLLFMKPPSAVIGDGEAIVRPAGSWRVDFEGELGVVIGKRCRRVSERDALSYVKGYTIVNDVTVRDLQKKDGQFTRAKGFDTFCPVGPWIETELDPSALRLVTRQNGSVKQDSSTSDLIFSVARIIEVASRVMTLEPGDLITTGTPSGVGPIQPGDVIEIEIQGIGTLRNTVVAEETT